jgi:hypothetical protein
MIRTRLARFALAGLLAGCSKHATATPEKTSQVATPPPAEAASDDAPPEIEPSDEPVVPAMENDESAGVKDPPADDPEAEESEHGDYE